MSEKLLPCPFCEADLEHSELLSTRRFKTFVHPRNFDRLCVAESIIIAETSSMERVKAWNRRTAAPEGEVVAALRALVRDCLANDFNELWDSYTAAQAVVAASPVVPVGVSRETLLKAVRPVLDRHPMIDSSQSHKLDIQAGWVADAILAAIRPTDTGWRDIATAPKDGSAFVGFGFLNRQTGGGHEQSPTPVSHVMRYRRYEDGGDWVSTCLSSAISQHPTHWMPLSPAPTDTGREA
jgi:hypothetical protein